MIIGTAGHIDHGKTALIKALTGVSGDRLKEEKARGVTIDLGFAYLPLAGGSPLGFIDVPGHERFVHTMLAGASGIDFVLLAVAADDGVMPQTMEHLAIIDLLGIRHGLIALTKVDLVSSARLTEVLAEIARHVTGTVLEGAEIIPVSALTGDGIDTLRQRLTSAAHQVAARSETSRFRLAVDRVFTLAGVGVVVTGTVLSGIVRIGEEVLISPSGVSARVRSLHAQNQAAEMGRAGDRCALNLVGDRVTKDGIHRGDVVLDPALHAPTDRIDARLRLLPTEAKAIKQWFPARLHHASVEVGAHIVLLGDEPIEPGAVADVQIVLDRPIAAAALDRFVIRDVSAQRTIGGGALIDLRPPARKRRTAERRAQRAALAIAPPTAAFEALLQVSPFAWDLATFARDRGLRNDEAERIVETLQLGVLEGAASRVAMLPQYWHAFTTRLLERLTAYHMENPDLQGIGREKLRSLLVPKLPTTEFVVALQRMAAADSLVLDGSFVRLPTHTVQLTPKDEMAWATIAPMLGGDLRFRPPRVRDIAGTVSHDERDIRRLLKLASRLGWVDEVAHDHFFLRSTVREMVAIVIDLAATSTDGIFTAANFRDRVDNGRKVAIQILDFFDRHGITVKRDDLRHLNKHRLDLFALTEQT